MQYYNPDDRSPRRWAIAAAVLYALTLAVSFAFVSFNFRFEETKKGDTILVEFTEPPVPETPEPQQPATEPRMHDEAASVEQTAQVSGKDDKTQTPNPKALFRMNKGGADEPDNAGNPRAPEGEDKARGNGPGLSTDGLVQLDQGLQERGLQGKVPKPSYPGGNRSGKVVVRVTVGPSGDVTSAAFEPKGSTIGDVAFIDAALAAARMTKFVESMAPVDGGTITYIFNLSVKQN